MVGFICRINFFNVIVGVLLILIGYQIKENIKLIKKYIYIYVVNLLIFIGLFLWTRSFTTQNLYDAVLPITLKKLILQINPTMLW